MSDETPIIPTQEEWLDQHGLTLETKAQTDTWLQKRGWVLHAKDEDCPVEECWHDYNPEPGDSGRHHRSFVFAYTTEKVREEAEPHV